METEKYTGPDYCLVKALDESKIEVRDNHGELIGLYPSWEMARSVEKRWEALALKRYLKTVKGA